MYRRFALVAVLAAFAIPASARAQARLTGADLHGTVTDQTGRGLPGATITVTNVDTNVSRTVSTDAGGRYKVPALQPGPYTINAAADGFRTHIRERLDLALGDDVKADFSLAVTAAPETVTVLGETQAISASRTEVSSVIGQQQIDALPSNGRNFIGFALLAPGVAADRTPLQGAAATSGLTFTGQRGRSNNVMVDGLDNNDLFVGSVRATFSQEAVREFQVIVDAYSAEFGKAAGGVVNIITRSGSNAFLGNAFFFFRDDALNARKYFDKYDVFGNSISVEKPPFSQHQGGATFGGPVRRNKTFFFAALERTDIEDARFVAIDPVAAQMLNALGFRVDLGNVPLHADNTDWLLKFDHHWTAARRLVARVTHADINREGVDDFGGIVARSRGTVQHRKDWSVSAAATDVLSNRWLTELRGQYANEDQHIDALDPACGGPCLRVDQGGPGIDVTGVAAVGRQRISPQIRLLRLVQVADTVSYLSGSHHVKFGGEYNHLILPREGNVLPGNFGGRFIFSPIPALGVTSALDGLQKGIPAAYAQGYGNPNFPEERYADMSLFVQDEWKRRRLVLKAGIRYQRQFWDAASFQTSDVGGGTFSFPLASDTNNIAPRIGVSYDAPGNGRTIARAAYGVFYDNVILAVENVGRVFTGTADGLRMLALPAPLAAAAWNAPGRRLSEPDAAALLGGSYVSTVLVPDPSLKNPFTHQASVGVDRAFRANLSLSLSGIYVRGFNMSGTLDYNPLLPVRLGPGRRPNDLPCDRIPSAPCVSGGIPRTSASVIQFTSFGETWYKGMTAALAKRLSHGSQFLVSYTLSKAEDTSTDYQSSFIAQNNGIGRNPADPFGPPLEFDPYFERGPALHDQRHRLVVSGIYQMPWNLQLSGIATAASGRPFTPLAGADLNGDGNGGQFPPDRARRNPADESTSVGRNSETTAAQMTVDLRLSKKFRLGPRGAIETMIEAFNLFNRTNFIEDTNQSSFVIFGTGAYPSEPLPAYGRYTLTLPPRQVQLAVKASF